MDAAPPDNFDLVEVDDDTERLKYYQLLLASTRSWTVPHKTVRDLWRYLMLTYDEDLDSNWFTLFDPLPTGGCVGDSHLLLKAELEACINDKNKDMSHLRRIG
jgi:hypothetical protein